MRHGRASEKGSMVPSCRLASSGLHGLLLGQVSGSATRAVQEKALRTSACARAGVGHRLQHATFKHNEQRRTVNANKGNTQQSQLVCWQHPVRHASGANCCWPARCSAAPGQLRKAGGRRWQQGAAISTMPSSIGSLPLCTSGSLQFVRRGHA